MMRVDLAFEKPLRTDEKLRLHLALGTLVKDKRVRVIRGDRLVTIYGESLGTRSVRTALEAEGLNPASIGSTLDAESDKGCDETNEQTERVRAIGR